MRLLSPSRILPTPRADKHCGHHYSTCISPQTPRTTYSTRRTPPRSTSILSNDCHTQPTVPHELPHWMPGRCHAVPRKTRQHQWHVTRHTAKFVFVPDNCHPNTIRILPKSLMIILPPVTSTPPAHCPNKAPRQHIALQHAADDKQTRTPGQREQDNIAYDTLTETAKITVTDGFVSFTRTFCYLGSLINYHHGKNCVSHCCDGCIKRYMAQPSPRHL